MANFTGKEAVFHRNFTILILTDPENHYKVFREEFYMLPVSNTEYELTMNELLAEIEKTRDLLVELGMNKGLQDTEVIFVSKQLDLLINQYYARI